MVEMSKVTQLCQRIRHPLQIPETLWEESQLEGYGHIRGNEAMKDITGGLLLA
jgi:hypothetical protein